MTEDHPEVEELDEPPYFYTDLEEGDGPVRPDYEAEEDAHDGDDFAQMPPADEDDPKNGEVF